MKARNWMIGGGVAASLGMTAFAVADPPRPHLNGPGAVAVSQLKLVRAGNGQPPGTRATRPPREVPTPLSSAQVESYTSMIRSSVAQSNGPTFDRLPWVSLHVEVDALVGELKTAAGTTFGTGGVNLQLVGEVWTRGGGPAGEPPPRAGTVIMHGNDTADAYVELVFPTLAGAGYFIDCTTGTFDNRPFTLWAGGGSETIAAGGGHAVIGLIGTGAKETRVRMSGKTFWWESCDVKAVGR